LHLFAPFATFLPFAPDSASLSFCSRERRSHILANN